MKSLLARQHYGQWFNVEILSKEVDLLVIFIHILILNYFFKFP